jgi:ABC-2 type transport system ATP-binding protein
VIFDNGRIAAIDTPEELRSTISSRQYIEVRFEGVRPELHELESLPGVLQVAASSGAFRLYSSLPGQVVMELVRLADRRGMGIADLDSRKPSLEDVYLHITSEGKQEGVQ